MTNVVLAIPFLWWVALAATLLAAVALRFNRPARIALGVWFGVAIVLVLMNPVSKPFNSEQRTALPPLPESGGEIRDVQRKPEMTEAQRTQHLDEKLDAVDQAKEELDAP